MLGLMRSSRASSWTWAAYGKHPAIKDYFRIGREFPLLRVFAGWIEDGYKQLSKSRTRVLHNSWHFWAKGAAGESIICGYVRDSSDGIGRNYPLLIIGAGPLCDWEENWELLPLACETVWRDIEYLSILDFSDLKEIDEEVRHIDHPEPRWQEYRSKKESFRNASGERPNFAVFPAEKKDSFIPLVSDSRLDLNLLSSCYHSFFKTSFKMVPNVVFMGRSMEKDFLRFYSKPLTPADFLSLWTAGEDKIVS